MSPASTSEDPGDMHVVSSLLEKLPTGMQGSRLGGGWAPWLRGQPGPGSLPLLMHYSYETLCRAPNLNRSQLPLSMKWERRSQNLSSIWAVRQKADEA